jgi:hypothetical protein
MPRRVPVALITSRSTCGGDKKAGLVDMIGARNRSHVQRKTAPNFKMGCARGTPPACCKPSV